MKKAPIAILLLVLLLASSAFAGEYENALRSANKESKPLLLYFFNKSCGYCTLMEKNTLADREIEALLKRDFVFLKVDTDKSVDLAMFYRVEGTPSSWFLDSTGKRILQAPGYLQKPLFKKVLEYIKGKYYGQMDIQAFLKKTSK